MKRASTKLFPKRALTYGNNEILTENAEKLEEVERWGEEPVMTFDGYKGNFLSFQGFWLISFEKFKGFVVFDDFLIWR